MHKQDIAKMMMWQEVQNVAVAWVRLGEVVNIKTGRSINKRYIAENTGQYPVINSGKEPLGYVNTFNTENDPIGITSRGAGVGYISWNEGRYFRGNLNYSATIKDSKQLCARFLYHYLKHCKYQIDRLCVFEGIPALNKSSLETLQIPLPPLAVQKKVAKTLDKLTKLTAELTAEHTLRQKQYQYYRDKLLNFDKQGGVEYVVLSDAATLIRGKRVVRAELNAKNSYPVYQNSLSPLGFYDNTNADANTTFVITAGAAGQVGFSTVPFWAADDCYIIKCANNTHSRFIYHALMHQQYRLLQKVRKASIPRLGRDALAGIKIPLPPLATQKRIANILDTFDTLTHSISEGLPAEIALRQKQYAYYRDGLLNFKA